jgi:hypothetical protein
MNVELGLWPCNSFSGNICFQFSVLVLCSVSLSPVYTFGQSLVPSLVGDFSQAK